MSKGKKKIWKILWHAEIDLGILLLTEFDVVNTFYKFRNTMTGRKIL